MPFRATVNRHYHRLQHASDRIVADSFDHVIHRCGTRTPHEPDLVAGLVLYGTRHLAAYWQRVLAPYQVSITGIFCHQNPMVRFGKNAGEQQGCELGDVMWVHEHTDSKGNISRNALLLQAKVCDGSPLGIGPKEEVQFKLYEAWPQFEYRQGLLAGTKRLVMPSSAHAGAQYLLIGDALPSFRRRPYWPPAVISSVSDPLRGWHSLGGALTMFLAGGTGRPFADQATAMAGRDWDAVVWDLLKISAAKAFNRRRAGYVNAPRQVAFLKDLDGIVLAAGAPSRLLRAAAGPDQAAAIEPDEQLDEIPPYDWVPSRDRDFDDEGGVSVMVVETREG